jgi:LPXTG-motif cell wall-anchored protein
MPKTASPMPIYVGAGAAALLAAMWLTTRRRSQPQH